jgi:hypothetical protein
MISPEIAKMLPKTCASLGVPITAEVEHGPSFEMAIFTPLIPLSIEPQQHSPPKLYIVKNSLLI